MKRLLSLLALLTLLPVVYADTATVLCPFTPFLVLKNIQVYMQFLGTNKHRIYQLNASGQFHFHNVKGATIVQIYPSLKGEIIAGCYSIRTQVADKMVIGFVPNAGIDCGRVMAFCGFPWESKVSLRG